ncbi:MAG: hypothetical protein P8Y94_06865, partial [Acidobacteriota bacterium]
LYRKDGHVVWSLERPYEYVSKLLLAYDRLYVMEEEMGLVSTSHLAAYDPDVGSLLWKIDLSTHGGPNGMAPIPSLWGSGIGNEVLYYLDYARGSILARNALTGTVLGRWGSNDGVTADLCLADGQLLILGARPLEIYEPSHGIFFAHIADGGGQTTLLTLTNISSAPTTGSVHFLNDEGEPLSVVIEGQEASMSTVPFSIPARSSIAIQTTGGSEVQSGWARAEADQPIRGSSIFQYSGNGLYSEAGVADAPASGQTSIFVSRTGNVSTAVAIAAPVGGGRWEMTLRLLDQEGLELASRSIWISYGNHLAQFIEELFPDEVGDSFQGTLAIESPFPVVVTALRTKNAIQLSSYPAAPTGQ